MADSTTAKATPRTALCSAVAEGTAVVRLLKQHGFTIRVQGPTASTAADVVLPCPRGSLAFVCHAGELRGSTTAQLSERAAQASRAARRCTIMWLLPDDAIDHDAMEALQKASPSGVNVVACRSHEEAVEFMIACSQHVRPAQVRASDDAIDTGHDQAAERACSMLAALWGCECHAIDFMLAARPLASLAKVASEHEWQQLLAETDGLLDPELLYTCVSWLQRDQQLDW